MAGKQAGGVCKNPGKDDLDLAGEVEERPESGAP